jgi:GT2 family glycosyltransferase
VSVVISTYNRSGALDSTLMALARQDLEPDRYEVLVIDDGSTDETPSALARIETPYELRTFRLDTNRGVSAGRNVGLRAARGRYVILLSDDLVVGSTFIATHVRTLERFADAWIVGGFAQLEDLSATPFGRYVSVLEQSFQTARIAAQLEDGVWEMTTPTARNLSLRRGDLERTGLFDEQFRTTCEDQDLAERARVLGIRFLYTSEIECIHNDHAADLHRYCRFQERGAADSVRLCRKNPELHGGAAIVIVNGRIARTDRPATIAKKLVKFALARHAPLTALERAIQIAERRGAPDQLLFRAYRAIIGLYTFRGWRTGLREAEARAT